jgi:uncharacterized caspase-like protein
MEARHAKVSVVLLDASRDNPLPAGTKSALKGLAPPAAARSGMVIAFATLPGQTAEDGEGGNSPFATALVKVLPMPGIDLRTALNKVAELTPKLAPSRRQQPQFYQTYVPDVIFGPGRRHHPNEHSGADRDAGRNRQYGGRGDRISRR